MATRTSELHLTECESTMLSARGLLAGQDFLLVTSGTQTGGKGTRGRAWQSPPGNVYMTVGIHRGRLPPERLALLPLELGLVLWEEAAARIDASLRRGLTLKWPNDLLLDGRKAAGMLMESHGDHLLCGVGVNVAVAPEVGDGGAPAARLADAGVAPEDCRAFAEGFYRRARAALEDPGSFDPEAVLMGWQARCDWNRAHRLRDREGMPRVQPVMLNRQGHLLVRKADGSTEWLVSDYLV